MRNTFVVLIWLYNNCFSASRTLPEVIVIPHLDVVSVQRGRANATQLLIGPVDPIVQEVKRQTYRPAQPTAQQHLPLRTIHPRPHDLRGAANLGPQHQAENKRSAQIY